MNLDNNKILKVHLALFFKNNIDRPADLDHIFKTYLDNLFDGMPAMFPLPDDIPGDVPLVHLHSKDETYSCQVAKKRIDFTYVPKADIDDFSTIVMKYNEIANKFIDAVYTYSPGNVIRMGCVLAYFVNNKNPTDSLNKIFLKKNLGKLDELSIRYTTRRKIDSILTNYLTSVISGDLLISPTRTEKGIVIEKDINVHISNNKILSTSFRSSFLDQAYKEFSRQELMKVIA